MRLDKFELAKELNDEFCNDLITKGLHFRPNENSISLISLNKESAELGTPNIKDRKEAIEELKKGVNKVNPEDSPKPEKELQAWIIKYAMNNDGLLPFGENIRFITSELVFKNKPEYRLEVNKRDIRNDILGFDENNKICIIELKYARDNYVKKQTIEFEKVVQIEKEFFHQLIKLYTNKEWDRRSIKKISVWPKSKGKTRTIKKEFEKVEEINYSTNEEKTEYKFE